MEYNDFDLPDIFEEFIENEITDNETFNLIYHFVAFDNFRHGEYEGNMFVIRKINVNHIQLENEIATENTALPSVHVYTKRKFLYLLKTYKPK